MNPRVQKTACKTGSEHARLHSVAMTHGKSSRRPREQKATQP